MQLREIRIRGFGTFAETNVHGLGPGLNVLHGPNEFGKTTLLEFVRRVLFGFPTRRGDSRQNQYLVDLHAGRYGGQLVCHMRDGRVITVSRTSGKSGGALSVLDGQGQIISPDAFYQALGNASSDLYHNVFSVGLEELYSINVLGLPEVKDRVYGAGLGLGDVSVTRLRKDLQEQADELYKPHGSAKGMNKLASDIVAIEKEIRTRIAQLSAYDERSRERDRLDADAALLRQRQKQLQTAQRTLSKQKSLYATFAEMRAARQKLTELAAVPDIPDETMEDLSARRQSITSLDDKLRETQTKLTAKRSEAASLAFDPALLQHEKEVKALSRSLAQYRDARRDLPVLTRDQEQAMARVRGSISALGTGWSEERVRSFDLSTEQDDALHRRQDALQSREKAADKASGRLDDYRVQTRALRARPPLPTIYRIVGLTILGLGIAGCVYFVRNGQWLPAILSGVTTALGLVLTLSLGSASGPLRDKAIEELEHERGDTIRLLQEERTAWAALLQSIGFAPSLSPEAVADQLQTLRALQVSLREVDDRHTRIGNMRTVLQTTDALFARVAAALAEAVPATDVVAGIETMDSRLDRAQNLSVRSDTLRGEISQLETQIAALSADLERARSEFATLMDRFGAATFEDFVILYERAAAARALRADIARSTLTIQSAAGVDAQFDAFIASLESTTPEQISTQLDTADEELATVEASLTASHQRIGALNAELSALATSEELLTLESRAENLKQELRDAYRDWLRARLALGAIERAVSQYETTRQPVVIREAQRLFTLMTGGRFTALLSPLGSEDLRVRDASGNEKAALNALSRGTKEQLYLAMRLGLIAQYEQNAEPLPVIMDDILVNFDDERAPLAVHTLAEFAKDRQVIVMTCHDATRRLYLDAGATEMSVERGGRLL